MGIIPAYAGSTRTELRQHRLFEDHPRIRGEHKIPKTIYNVFQGSSPHTRGARHHPDRARSAFGIIPAYAGSTPTPTWNRRAYWDHPRIRGEHLAVGEVIHSLVRIIPAYAGSTTATGCRPWFIEDHPRIRGEHAKLGFGLAGVFGSSPHTRGALRRGGVLVDFAGIIPAYAGSTESGPTEVLAARDHPRIRGEHRRRHRLRRHRGGSSPHTRGAPLDRERRLRRARIIPAYAGSTTKTFSPPRAARDHPRIRGEHESR